MNRCPWCLINELETKYHDDEWGVPVYDDVKQFEYLMLEAMQCGLSWDRKLNFNLTLLYIDWHWGSMPAK